MKGNDLLVDILPKDTKAEPVSATASTGLKKSAPEAAPGLKKVGSKPEESKAVSKVTAPITKEVKKDEGAKADPNDPIEIAIFARK